MKASLPSIQCLHLLSYLGLETYYPQTRYCSTKELLMAIATTVLCYAIWVDICRTLAQGQIYKTANEGPTCALVCMINLLSTAWWKVL